MTRPLRWLVRAAVIYSLACVALTLGSLLLTPACSTVEQPYDIAVVLGGGDELRKAVQEAETGRVHSAVRLYRRGLVQHLHLTGGGPDGRSSNAPLLARLARDKGLPDTVLSTEARSLSTLQNALFSRPYLPSEADLILVTEAFHAWRAKASFVWAGRPAAICASPEPGRRLPHRTLHLVREVAAWGANILRAGAWSIGRAMGLETRLPQFLLI
ncbi:YdcF family protein [Mameliella sp.]|uniref:YdcF family protein n=1 Tax=Mameliella sp. TaxID=1924940 RepID=UPI003BAC75A1